MAEDKDKGGEEEERAAMMAASTFLSQLVLPGYAFNPSDNDLVQFYLTRKLRSSPLPLRLFYDFDIYSCNPKDIPPQFAAALAFPKLSGKDETKKMFFFTPRHPAASSASTTCFNRTAGNGFWHGNNNVKLIYDGHNKIVGRKTSFQYKQICLHPNERSNKRSAIDTNWIMHEYCLPDHKVDDIVLSVIYENKSNTRESDSEYHSDES